MISVIVPIYNIVDYLPHCLDSIVNQTYRDLEIILVDDGSTDSSGSLCDEYAKKDSRVRVIHKANGGLSDARNVGLEQVTGEYVLMPDGDDVLHPQMIETLYNLIISGDYDFSMCYGEKVWDISLIQDKSKSIIKFAPSHKLAEIPFTEPNRDELMNLLFCGEEIHLWYAVAWNKLYRRSLLEGMRFEDICPEDIEFNNRVFLKTRKAIVTSLCLYYYVQRSNSILHQGVNQTFAKWSIAWYQCLNTIPVENTLYRGWVLRQLYRTIPSRILLTRGTPYHHIALENGNRIIRRTYKMFITNRYIPIVEKIQLLIYNVPICYRLFISMTETWAKIRK
ncbi:MAG: glycosyltransferase [Bacteroidales bacterium]|nr:glycosyltransferase [Bacteroidales bacterium]